MRGAVKGLLGRTLFGASLDAVFLRGAAVVVAFHRVQETAEADDGLTIGARLFERYCRFFRRHFRVVPLREVVGLLESGRPLDRELAITFDDGYRDNFEVAAPILERLSLPATFFTVTEWMETRVVPWWDQERGVQHPWMTWDEVRALRRRGFDIGAHTRTHVDLGRVSRAEAEREIFGARADLESRIGGPVDLFAYPYGGADNLAEPHRDLVKAAGFRCCCSSFGGVNTTGTSPHHLRRVPISSWHASPSQFGFDVALRRSVMTA